MDHKRVLALAKGIPGERKRDQVLVALAGLTGMPVKKLLALTWGDVTTLVKTKGFAYRDDVRDLLDALREVVTRTSTVPEEAPLFASRKKGSTLTPDGTVERSPRAISRVQAHRVVTEALGALHARGSGVFTLLRRIAAGAADTLATGVALVVTTLTDEAFDDVLERACAGTSVLPPPRGVLPDGFPDASLDESAWLAALVANLA